MCIKNRNFFYTRNEIKEELKKLISDGIWEKGANRKGVLVFAKPDVKLEKMEWDSFGMRVFIPIMINDSFPLIAVWTTKPAYIEEFYIWQLVNSGRINEDVVIIGDFNSNAVWDWMDFSIGSSACHIAVTQIQKRNAIGVELYINDS